MSSRVVFRPLCWLIFGHEPIIEINERENKSEYVCERCRAVLGDFVINLRKPRDNQPVPRRRSPEGTDRTNSDFVTVTAPAGDGGDGKLLTPVQVRFEAWLRSQGYLPAQHLCAPDSNVGGDRVTDDAADRLWDYLEVHPEDEPYRKELMGHATDIGELSPSRGG